MLQLFDSVQSRMDCIEPDTALCDTQPAFYCLSITHSLYFEYFE